MRRARHAALALVLAAALAPAGAGAEPYPLRHDLRVDAAIAATGWALYVSAELAKGRLAPDSCRFACAEGDLDAGARSRLVWDDVRGPRAGSDALGFALVPAAAMAHQLLAARGAGDAGAGLVDAVLLAKVTAIAMDLNQLVKLAAGRPRPFVRHAPAGELGATDADDRLSFFSGHTTFTFALATAAGTLSDLRGYRSAPWVWGVGLALAGTTGWLRIAGDKHYLSDVLVGAAVGAAAGIALPRLLHPREGGRDGAPAAQLTAVPLGLVLTF